MKALSKLMLSPLPFFYHIYFDTLIPLEWLILPVAIFVILALLI
jgi:hypothetical protein